MSPRHRRGGPGAFQAAGDGVVADAALVPAGPAQALLSDVSALRLGAHELGVSRAVRLAEGVAAGREGDGLLVVHSHSGEGLANVAGRLQGVGVAARTFRIDVDEAHLHGGEGVLQDLLLGDPGLPEPLLLGAPVDVLLRLEDVFATAAEAEDRAAHGFDGDVAGQDHQIGPGELAAILLLDRPQQAPSLVEIAVVRPAVQRGEALIARAAAAPPVPDAISASAVPGHADEERAVVAVVRRPPGLAVGHERGEVTLDRREVERLEFLGVIEARAHRIAARAVLVQDVETQLVRPPIPVGAAEERAERGAFAGGVVERSRAGVVGHDGLLGKAMAAPNWASVPGESHG